LQGTFDTCQNCKLFEHIFRGTGLLPSGVLQDRGALELDPDINNEVDDPEVDRIGIQVQVEIDEIDIVGSAQELRDDSSDQIMYEAWKKVKVTLANGECKDKYDFVSITVPLRDYWLDLCSYVMFFEKHCDLARWCSGSFGSFNAPSFPRSNFGLVNDASEAHKHLARREHQSAFFQQVSSTLWVLVLVIHVEDLGNIDESEKTKLLEFHRTSGTPAVIKETHFFATQDKLKDQAMVQHILRFLMDYVKGTGRYAVEGMCATCGFALPSTLDGNTCGACGGIADFYSQNDLDSREIQDANYYRGNGAPAKGVKFTWFHAFTDGCTAQFFCAVFLLFLSSF
jgi:hypothetical protein